MERTYKYNNSKVTIRFGNIIDSEAEVIVSSDDCWITMGGGVSMSIRRAEGTGAIEQDVQKKVPVNLGDVVVSNAGKLKQKFIFHAITIGFIKNTPVKDAPEEEVQEYIIKNSVTKCLNLMRNLNVSSIAFPTIGGGLAGIPLQKIARVMASSISDFLLKTNYPYNIELFIFSTKNHPDYIQYLDFFEQFAACVDSKEERHIQTTPCETNISVHENYDVFISYSRLDSSVADEIIVLLKELNLRIWIDRSGDYSGRNYKSVIVNTIRNSNIVLFLSSERSNKSDNVIKEISVAVEQKKHIIPIKIDNAPYADSIAYDLTGIDYINYSEQKEELVHKIFSQLTLIRNS